MARQRAEKRTTAKPVSASDQPHDAKRDMVGRSESESKQTDEHKRREQIARRAYELWQHRGGDPVENWLAAESELSARTSAAAPHKMPNE